MTHLPAGFPGSRPFHGLGTTPTDNGIDFADYLPYVMGAVAVGVIGWLLFRAEDEQDEPMPTHVTGESWPDAREDLESARELMDQWDRMRLMRRTKPANDTDEDEYEDEDV